MYAMLVMFYFSASDIVEVKSQFTPMSHSSYRPWTSEEQEKFLDLIPKHTGMNNKINWKSL